MKKIFCCHKSQSLQSKLHVFNTDDPKYFPVFYIQHIKSILQHENCANGNYAKIVQIINKQKGVYAKLKNYCLVHQIIIFHPKYYTQVLKTIKYTTSVINKDKKDFDIWMTNTIIKPYWNYLSICLCSADNHKTIYQPIQLEHFTINKLIRLVNYYMNNLRAIFQIVGCFPKIGRYYLQRLKIFASFIHLISFQIKSIYRIFVISIKTILKHYGELKTEQLQFLEKIIFEDIYEVNYNMTNLFFSTYFIEHISQKLNFKVGDIFWFDQQFIKQHQKNKIIKKNLQKKHKRQFILNQITQSIGSQSYVCPTKFQKAILFLQSFSNYIDIPQQNFIQIINNSNIFSSTSLLEHNI